MGFALHWRPTQFLGRSFESADPGQGGWVIYGGGVLTEWGVLPPTKGNDAAGAIAARQALDRYGPFSVDCRDCLAKRGLGMIKKIESYPELADPQLQPRKAHRLMRARVKYLCLIIGAFAGRDISVIAFCIERHPVRSRSASQGQLLLQRRSHRVQHAPDIHEWDTSAALPNFTLVRGPADSMQQPGLSGWMIWDTRSNDLARFDISWRASRLTAHPGRDVARAHSGAVSQQARRANC